jgi:hypothetical protein
LVIYVWRAFLNSKSYKVIKMYNLNWTCLKALCEDRSISTKLLGFKKHWIRCMDRKNRFCLRASGSQTTIFSKQNQSCQGGCQV